MADFDKQKVSIGIAIGAVVFLMGSVATAAWWCATTTNTIGSLKGELVSIRSENANNYAAMQNQLAAASNDRYTGKDAARDIRDRDRVDGDLQREIDKMQNDLAETKAAINRVKDKP